MPLYTYACDCGLDNEVVSSIDDRPDSVKCGDCGKKVARTICAPAIHTLETFMRGVQGVNTNCDGSYQDPNLFDRKKGIHPVIKSKKHREQVMQELGLQELGTSQIRKDYERSKGRMTFV